MHQRILRLTLLPLLLIVGLASQRATSARAATLTPQPRHYLAQVYKTWPIIHTERPQAQLPGNFPFQTITSSDGLVAVHYYNQSADFAKQVITQIAGYVQHPVKDTLGYGLKGVANIYLYNSRADFLTGTSSPDSQEIGAFTLFSTSSIYMPVVENGVSSIAYYLPHELTHLVFHQNNDSGHVKGEIRFYPLWLDEGLASADDVEGVQQLEDALAQYPYQNIFSVFVNDYPASISADLVGYGESRRFILFLEKTYGMTAFHQFILDLHNGDYNLAMEEAFGADMQTIRAKWLPSLGQPALKHDTGQAVKTPTVKPYTPGQLDSSITQTTPYAIAGQESFINGALARGMLITLFGLLGVGGAWLLIFMQRRAIMRPPAPVNAAPQFAPYPPYGMPPGYPPQGQGYPPPAPGYPPPYGPPPGQGYPPPYSAPQGPGYPQPYGAPSAPNYPPPYGPPATPGNSAPYGAPPQAWQPAAPYAPNQAAPPAVLTAERTKPLPQYPWLDLVLAALIAPIAIIFETIWPAFAPPTDWTLPYLVALIVAALLGVALVVLAVRALTRQRLNAAHGVGVAVALLVVVTAFSQLRALSLAQGVAYEANNSLALAHRFEQNAGASGSDLARIDAAWAADAGSAGDLATQIAHLRTALSEDPGNSQASVWRGKLLATTDDLGQRLIAAGHYGDAEAVYHAQDTSAICDKDCRTLVEQGGSTALIDWARTLVGQHDMTDATAKLQLAASRYSQADGGKSATRILANQTNPLKGAFAAANAGDQQATAFLAYTAYVQQPQTLTAIEATEISAPTTGVIRKQIGSDVNGEQVFFIGFTSKSAASAFLTTAQTDESVIKVLSTIGNGGKFSVLLPPGYWYVPIWDDPTQASNYYFNYSNRLDGGVFFVAPFFTNDGGTIVGA